jgi:hypothetical protein
MRTRSSLSKRRILISLLLFISISPLASPLNIFVHQYEISLMFSMNVLCAVLLYYDWNLFGIHYNRAKSNIRDTILYGAIGLLLLCAWRFFCVDLLKAEILVPNGTVLRSYGYARPGMMTAYSLMESCALSIAYKCLTDHIVAKGKELQTILLSGLLSGILATVLFFPYSSILSFICTLLYSVGTMIILAYLYNQTRSIISGIFSIAFLNLLIMIFSLI